MTLSEYCGAVGNVGMGTTLRPRATACIALRPQVGHRTSLQSPKTALKGETPSYYLNKSDLKVVTKDTKFKQIFDQIPRVVL